MINETNRLNFLLYRNLKQCKILRALISKESIQKINITINILVNKRIKVLKKMEGIKPVLYTKEYFSLFSIKISIFNFKISSCFSLLDTNTNIYK